MKLIKSGLILLFALMNFSSLISQTDTIQNSLKKKSLSLQFGIAANLSLQSFNDYSISVKYHISRKSAFRLGLGGNFSNSKGTSNLDSIFRDDYRFAYNYSIELNYLFYFNPSSTVNIFFGGGPIANLGFIDEKSPYGTDEYDYREVNSWSIGPKFAAGGEWFFLKKLSLFAEYEVSWIIGKSTETQSYKIISTGESHYYKRDGSIFEFNGNTARLGLSIYF